MKQILVFLFGVMVGISIGLIFFMNAYNQAVEDVNEIVTKCEGIINNPQSICGVNSNPFVDYEYDIPLNWSGWL